MIDPASPTTDGARHRKSLALKQTLAVLMASTALGIVSAHAVDATWIGGNAGDPNEWTEGANWTGGNVPDGTATLSTSGTTSIDSNGVVNVGRIQFSAAPNAPAYTINTFDLMVLNATGVFNNSTNTQTFNTTSTTLFQNSSTASGGSKPVTYANTGAMIFLNLSTAGTAIITNNSALQFSNTSTAGSATITNNVVTDFFDSSSAGTTNITNAAGATLTFHDASTASGATIGNSGDVLFLNSSTAGSSHITNATGSTLTFNNSSTAGSAQINTTGIGVAITFNDSSSAGNAAFTANASTFGTITFNNTSSASNAHIDLVDTNLVFNNSSAAGSAIITMSNVAHPGNITFNDTSSAGNANITNVAVTTLGAKVWFLGASTAANATITNNPNSSVPGEGGVLQFGVLGGTDTANAGAATIINNQFGSTSFFAQTMAMNALITNNSGGSTNFQDQSSAGSATIVNHAGGTTSFGVPAVGTDTATAGNASITNNSGGSTTFAAATTAGNAAITTNGGGTVSFLDTSTGGAARFITNAGGTFDMSSLTSAGMTAGSIEGAGNYFLGSKKLTVGSNNLSTTVNGIISDGGTGGGAGGSLVKVGTGTLVLTGTDTYTGGTTISAGTLQLGNGGTSGSIVGNVLNNSIFAINRSNAITLAGVISGSGALNQIGTGITALTAANTYTGLTTISAGTLALTGAGSIAGSSGVVANSIFDISGVAPVGTSIQSLSGSGSVALGAKTLTLTNASGNFSGSIGGSGGVALTGGTQTLSGVNGYTGATTVTASTLALAGVGSIASSSGVVVNGAFDISGVAAASALITTLSGSGSVALGNKTLTLTNASGNFTGSIGGAGGLTIAAGAESLSGANTYSGLTTITTGALTLVGAGSIASSSVVANGTFDISAVTPAGTSIASLAGAGSVMLGGKTLTISNAAGDFGGVIGGTGGLTVVGGKQTLSGANTYTGGTTINAGTLQLGNGGATGSIVGNVTDNGVFAINHANAFTFGGVISGTGVFQQIGAGTTVLTAANTYSGGTTINAGAVVLGNGGTSGSIAGNVTDNGMFGINRSDSVTFGGLISGTGAFNQIGIGATTLTADNTYSGGTTISAGTLQLGNGGTTGSILGNITDNGVLAVNRSNAFTLGGVISGTGAFNQIGIGTTILTADNTYSGGTTISAGTLQLGNGGTTGSILGNITDNGVLAVNRSNAFTLGGVISGTGAVQQNGTGTTTLSGINTYIGPTTINAGTLSVNGSITSAVTVNNGGTLGGTGTVGSTTVNSGGNLAPGNSIGIININGNLVLGAGSVYTVEVSPTAADRTNVTGTASLNGTLNAIFAPGAYSSNGYTVLTTTGGLTGTFSAFTTSGLPATLSASLAYTPTDLMLVTLTSQIAPVVSALTGNTPNQRAVARAQDTAFNAGRPGIGALYNLTLAQLPGALDQLSGEVHPSTVGVLVDESLYARSAILGRLRQASYGGNTQMASLATGGPQAFAGGEEMNAALAYANSPIVTKAPPMAAASSYDVVYWAQGFGAWGRFNGDGNAANVDRSLAGFFTGVDTRVGTGGRAGIAAGYTGSRNTLDGRGSSTVDTGHIAGYGGWGFGALNLRAGADYAFHTIDTSRAVFFPGFFDTDTAHYNGGTAQIFGEAGYGFAFGKVAVEPFAGGGWVNLRTDAFNERGGAAALSVAASTFEIGYSTLGTRAATMIPLTADMVLVPRASAAWQHAFGSVTPTDTMAFQAAGVPFVITGVPIARNAALAEAGIDLAIGRNATVGISYTGQIANNVQDHGAKGKFFWKF